MASTGDLLMVLALLAIGVALGAVIGVLWARARPDPGEGVDAVALAQADTHRQQAVDRALVTQGLERLAEQLQSLEHERVSWQGQFDAQVRHVATSTEHLRRETQALGDALRKPQVRGRWGELHLRRTVELAGLVDHCDFTEQARFDDGRHRPDLVVHLAGGRNVVVDSKVSLDAYADAARADAAGEREGHLARHARQVRTHVDQLAAKAYWQHLDSPEFVVLFLPAESLLSAALEQDPGLLEHAAGRDVLLATPTTLIALLRTVAHGWAHESLTQQAHEVQVLGQELHSRLGILGGHVDTLGRALSRAVESYNQTVGSLEARVLVTARRFEELRVTREELPTPRQVEVTPRRLSDAPVDPLGEPMSGDVSARRDDEERDAS